VNSGGVFVFIGADAEGSMSIAFVHQFLAHAAAPNRDRA